MLSKFIQQSECIRPMKVQHTVVDHNTQVIITFFINQQKAYYNMRFHRPNFCPFELAMFNRLSADQTALLG